jgi:glycerol-3-phosphate acyltransferase PlsY
VDFLAIASGLITAYLLGSIPTAVWIGKWFYGKDVREEGSGNAGATNTIRVLGVKAGIPVIIMDILKGSLAVMVMGWLSPQFSDPDVNIYLEIAAGLAAVIGHTLPVFAGFRGGKGVATLLGAGLALYGSPVLISVGVFIVVLLLTRYVSLSSVLAGVSFPFVVIFYSKITNPGLVGLSIFAALFLIWTHRKNFGRLIKGEENRVVFRKRKGDSEQ